jgi:hypothetical protein
MNASLPDASVKTDFAVWKSIGRAQLAREVREDVPARQRVARRRDGRVDALDHAELVRERAVELGPAGERQRDVGRLP